MKTLKLTTLKLLTLAIGLWTLDLGLWTARAQTTVVFSLVQMTGATNDTMLTIRAVHNPVQWKGQAAWFPPGGITLQTVNGAATTNLIPNDYTVSIAGVPGAWRISVADTNVTLNAALIGNLTTYSFTDPTPGVIQLLPGAGNIHVSPANGKGAVTLTADAVTNVVGTNGLSSISGNTLLNNTNYDPFGSAAAATNALGLNSGLAAFAPTNRFDAAGAAATASTNLFALTNAQAGSNLTVTITRSSANNSGSVRIDGISSNQLAILLGAFNGVAALAPTNQFDPNGAGLAMSNNVRFPIFFAVDGDSLSANTNGVGTNIDWAHALWTNSVLRAISTYSNSAVSGDFATNINNNYGSRDEPQITNAVNQGRTVYWMPYCGINDIDNLFGTNVAFQALSNLWLKGHNDGARVVAFQLPYNYGYSGGAQQLIDLTNLNALIAANTNLYDYLISPLDALAQGDTVDGLHYAAVGQQKFASYIFRIIFGGGKNFGRIPNLLVGTINGVTPGQEWSIDLGAAWKYAVTNLTAGGTAPSPTFSVYDACFWTTNAVAYVIIPVPHGNGYTNVVSTLFFEGEAGSTPSTISGFSTEGKRVPSSGTVSEGVKSFSFSIGPASQTIVSVTNSWSNDTDPRFLILLSSGFTAGYGKPKLYLDDWTLRFQ
jgi:hypothetical protein